MIRVKVCCISSIEEANIAIRFGASALGLVGKMPSGPGVITDEMIAEIALATPPPIATFLLTSETATTTILNHYQKVHTNTIQLVDDVSYKCYRELRAQLPMVKLVQVIHVANEQSVEEAQAIAPHVDAILLDSGNPNLEVKVLGGTGKTHNWIISRKIVEAVSVPVFLAGGLNPENAQRAVEEVNPFGLDICSGVRTNGRLDPVKLEAFFKAIGY